MVTIHTSQLSENLGFNGEDIIVKSVSAAWNKIREIRDTTDPKVLNGTLLKVTGDKETPTKDRIPRRIRFELSKSGKILFKNAYKAAGMELTVGPVTFLNTRTGERTTVQSVDPFEK